MDSAVLSELRLQMLKFATLQLSDSSLAEDAVQEALIGAFKNAGSFGGKAALKTWVFAILKNKIADILRKCNRLNEAKRLEKDKFKWPRTGDTIFNLSEEQFSWILRGLDIAKLPHIKKNISLLLANDVENREVNW